MSGFGEVGKGHSGSGSCISRQGWIAERLSRAAATECPLHTEPWSLTERRLVGERNTAAVHRLLTGDGAIHHLGLHERPVGLFGILPVASFHLRQSSAMDFDRALPISFCLHGCVSAGVTGGGGFRGRSGAHGTMASSCSRQNTCIDPSSQWRTVTRCRGTGSKDGAGRIWKKRAWNWKVMS